MVLCIQWYREEVVKGEWVDERNERRNGEVRCYLLFHKLWQVGVGSVGEDKVNWLAGSCSTRAAYSMFGSVGNGRA